MAIFDLARQRLCVRVVYDGAASAGKTTNVRQLAEIFATQRAGELFSPAELDGRTLYFDWLQIVAGMICGFPLLCQVITVPGQVVLTPRRRHLLLGADVVVHVVDSADDAPARAREGLGLFEETERERGAAVPLVVQANKQDQRGAIAGAAIASALGRGDASFIEAIASDGVGVVDTFVAAVRAVARSIQARVDAGDARIPIRPALTAARAFVEVDAQAVDPEWAVEMLLEQASNTLALELAFDDRPRETIAPDAEPETDDRRVPTPNESVPTGFVWPAHTGRQVLRTLAREELLTTHASRDERGAARVVAGDYVLTTSDRHRFESSESARQALVRAARETTQLETLLAPETVLVVQPSPDASWLWTIRPRMPTVAERLAADATDADRGALLEAFGSALALALRLEATHGIVLDLAPESFGASDGAVRYLGGIARATDAPRNAGQELVDTFAALQAFGSIDAALASFEAALASLPASSDALDQLEDRFRAGIVAS